MIDTLPIQVALYQALTEAPQTYPVYDAVPQGASLPHIVIGEFTGMPDDELTASSIDLTVNIHAWSKQNGKSEAHQMLAFVRDRLDHATIAGAWACFEEWVEVMEDRDSTADSRRFHGVARYRVRAN